MSLPCSARVTLGTDLVSLLTFQRVDKPVDLVDRGWLSLAEVLSAEKIDDLLIVVPPQVLEGETLAALDEKVSAKSLQGVLEGLEPVKCEESLNLTLLGISHLLVFDFEPW